jgi:hypothetical protein
VNVKPTASSSLTETLKFEVTGGKVVLKWENTEVGFKVK